MIRAGTTLSAEMQAAELGQDCMILRDTPLISKHDDDETSPYPLRVNPNALVYNNDHLLQAYDI
jgi:hypothetical protein